MTFNALMSKLDDHPRNHALMAKHKDCKLAPAHGSTPAEAAGVIDDMERNVRERRSATAREAGVYERDCEKITAASVYAGFRQTARTI